MQELLSEDGGFGEYTALLEDDATSDSPAKDGQPALASVSADARSGQLPWVRASQRIRSPLLRLHNGALPSRNMLGMQQPTEPDPQARQHCGF